MAVPDLRKIPKVDSILAHPGAQPLIAESGREFVASCLAEVFETLRGRLRAGGDAAVDPVSILSAVRERLAERSAPRLCRAINATGVILHTGLGRAVLSRAALEAIASEQKGYSLLEVDRETGERSQREIHVARLIGEIAGSEAATVVNNNAGATLLALATLAKGREVITSRGQLVEIGGSFRIPDVMKESGASLVEVGTTNKTYIGDYENAITERTALLLRVHPSNYRILGFTQTPSLEELVALGRKRGIPVMDDLGSGAFIDLGPFGVADEPTVQSSVRSGADVITFSGDKLLGGPQAGLIVGRKDAVGRIRKHPLFRALRVDKLTLTALEATLKLYLDRERLLRELPTLRMISMSLDEAERRALSLAAKLKGLPGLSLEVRDDASEFGGGSVPTQEIPTKVVALRHASLSLEEIASRLRQGRPPVFARVQRERLLLDVRTLQEGEDDEIAASLGRLLA
ncbi:MAG TPA: L-seryl-tRNA(Sec) selenium transferase [Planctomycetota bacterium]|nr:L-seryl-tRNA(Sec) selenium transferase [Planctomycetota bacterium]